MLTRGTWSTRALGLTLKDLTVPKIFICLAIATVRPADTSGSSLRATVFSAVTAATVAAATGTAILNYEFQCLKKIFYKSHAKMSERIWKLSKLLPLLWPP